MEKEKKGWKIYNSDPITWRKMIIYYKWCASIFCLLFASVLMVEKIWILSISMFIFAWLANPCNFIRKFDIYFGKQKKIIVYMNLIIMVIGIYFIVNSIVNL